MHFFRHICHRRNAPDAAGTCGRSRDVRGRSSTVVDRRHNPNDTDNQAHTGRGRRYRNAGRLAHPCHGTDGTQARRPSEPPLAQDHWQNPGR